MRWCVIRVTCVRMKKATNDKNRRSVRYRTRFFLNKTESKNRMVLKYGRNQKETGAPNAACARNDTSSFMTSTKPWRRGLIEFYFGIVANHTSTTFSVRFPLKVCAPHERSILVILVLHFEISINELWALLQFFFHYSSTHVAAAPIRIRNVARSSSGSSLHRTYSIETSIWFQNQWSTLNSQVDSCTEQNDVHTFITDSCTTASHSRNQKKKKNNLFDMELTTNDDWRCGINVGKVPK